MNKIEANNALQTALKLHAQGGRMTNIDAILKAAGRTRRDFDREVEQTRAKIEAGAVGRLRVQAVPPRKGRLS